MSEDKVKIVGDGMSTPYLVEAIKAASEGRKGQVTAKHVLIVVACVVVASIIAGGLIGGAHVFKSVADDINQIRLNIKDGKTGKVVSETMTIDRGRNIIEYHLKDEGVEQWILHDFNKDLTVFKTTGSGETHCFIEPLDETGVSRPNDIRRHQSDDTEQVTINNGSDVQPTFLKSADEPIRETKFLGERINKLCRGVDIYWAFPTCAAETTKDSETSSIANQPSGDRHKRSVRYPYRCVPVGCWRICLCYVGYRIEIFYVNGILKRRVRIYYDTNCEKAITQNKFC